MVAKKAPAKKRTDKATTGGPGTNFSKTIRAKRRASGVDQVIKKAARGERTAKRAYVRMGEQNTNIITGRNDVSEWTEEELAAGRRMDKAGGWSGRPPAVVPKRVHDELVKRTLQSAQDHLRNNLEGVVEVLVDLALNENVEPKDRIRAINMVMDRVMGKVPDTVNLRPDMPWVNAITDGIVPTANGSIDTTLDDDDD